MIVSRRLSHLADVYVSNVDKLTNEGEIPVRLCNYVDVYKNETVHPGLDLMEATATPWEIVRFRLVPGDTVFTKDSETADDIGVPAFVTETADDFVCGYHLAIARPRRGLVDPKYLYWWLRSSKVARQWEVRAAGVTRVGLRQTDIGKLPLEVVDDVEFQHSIAEFLDRETAQIDATIDAQQRLVEALRARRVATIWHGVTKGLGNADLTPSGVDWIGEVPQHWDVTRLRNSIQSAVPGVWGDDPRGDDSDVKCVRVADFDRPRNRVLSAAVETMRSVNSRDRDQRELRRGDLLLEKSGGTAINPVGFVVRYESDDAAVYSNFITRLRLVPGQDSRYWNYAHAASYSTRLTQRSVKQTTGIQNLDQSAYFSERFPYPPLEEQSRIADHLDDATGLLDDLIAKVAGAIELIRERRAAVITAAVTGRIDPRTGVERLDDIMEGAAL